MDAIYRAGSTAVRKIRRRRISLNNRLTGETTSPIPRTLRFAVRLARLAEESGWFDNVLRTRDLVYCSRIKPERTTAILDRLKQRKLVQWALAYLAGAWFVMQLVDVLGGRWGVTEYMARVVDLVLVVGLFVTLVVAWYHGEKGRQRVSGP